VLVDGGRSNRPGLLLGVDLKRETGYLDPETMVVEGRLPATGQAEVMVGRAFAENMEISVGDTVTLLGQTAYRSLGGIRLTVTGTAVSGMGYLDNMMLIAPLDQAQDMTYLDNAATEILVFADEPEQAATLITGLEQALTNVASDKLEILSWRDQGPLVKVLDTGRAAFSIILFILLAMATLIIVNTLLMTVMERTREFGMQAALGMRRRDIVRLILMEGLTIGLLGAFLGGFLGAGVALWLEHTGIDLGSAANALKLPFKAIVYPDWQPLYTIISGMVGIVAALLAAIYPAWKAIKITPAEALRT
jgi:putative ABC transport system permease protein